MTACHILGISAFYLDSAACLLRDGEIVAAAQEEHFTRKKGHLPADQPQASWGSYASWRPIRLIMRAVGRNPSYYRAPNGSYWASRDHPRGSLTNQF